MAKIYKLSDRRTIQLNDITVSIAPLSLDQRSKYTSYMAEAAKTNNLSMATEAIYYSIRCSLKSLDGVTDSDDKAYKLQFEDNMLTEECLQELLTLEQNDKLQKVCSELIQDYAKSSFDIEGVEVKK